MLRCLYGLTWPFFTALHVKGRQADIACHQLAFRWTCGGSTVLSFSLQLGNVQRYLRSPELTRFTRLDELGLEVSGSGRSRIGRCWPAVRSNRISGVAVAAARACLVTPWSVGWPKASAVDALNTGSPKPSPPTGARGESELVSESVTVSTDVRSPNVVRACGAQSMMSPESGSSRRTSPSIWTGTASTVANSTRLTRARSPSNGHRAQRHGDDSPSASVPMRHHLEQPIVGATKAAEPTVLGHPCHVGEHQAVVQLPPSSRSDDLHRRELGEGPQYREQLSDRPFPVRFSPTAINGVSRTQVIAECAY